MPQTARKDFESQGNASFGVIYLTAGQTTSLNGWAFVATQPCVIGSVTAKVYTNAGVLTNLAGVTVPTGAQIPVPYCKSFTLTSGAGFLIRTDDNR